MKEGVALGIYMFEAIRRLAYQVSFFHVMMLPLFSACIFNSPLTFHYNHILKSFSFLQQIIRIHFYQIYCKIINVFLYN